jgi:hypothetical protein
MGVKMKWLRGDTHSTSNLSVSMTCTSAAVLPQHWLQDVADCAQPNNVSRVAVPINVQQARELHCLDEGVCSPSGSQHENDRSWALEGQRLITATGPLQLPLALRSDPCLPGQVPQGAPRNQANILADQENVVSVGHCHSCDM